MNLEFYEFLETWCTGILKVESRTLWIFWILGMGILGKMNLELLWIFGNLGMRILKNEFGILRIFRNLAYENFKKWIWNFTKFWKLGLREF